MPCPQRKGLHCSPPKEKNVFDRNKVDSEEEDERSNKCGGLITETADGVTGCQQGRGTGGEENGPDGETGDQEKNGDRDPVESGGDLPVCETDTLGDFGAVDTASTAVSVQFIYQVQTKLELSAPALDHQVLGELEKSLADLVVPPLFDGDKCIVATDQARNAARRRYLQLSQANDNGSELTGISTLPDDSILLGAEGGT